jgi:DNA-binding transcriptional LysR family regulator
MDRLQVRELEYFVAVAEELHFGRAADRFGITQPPLSRAIAGLERRLGVVLFTRTSRSVALTAAGTVLFAEAQGLLAGLDTAVRRAQRAGRSARLIVAAKPGSGTGLLRDIVDAYREREPDVAVEVLFAQDVASAVRDGRADVALLCSTEDKTGMRTLNIGWEFPVALLPSAHALAGNATVSIADLERDPVYSPLCPEAAFDEVVDLVALGRLVVVASESAASRLGPGVVAIPVADGEGTVLALAWDSDAPPVEGFVAAARALVAGRATARVPSPVPA